jgi:hypothetical protein
LILLPSRLITSAAFHALTYPADVGDSAISFSTSTSTSTSTITIISTYQEHLDASGPARPVSSPRLSQSMKKTTTWGGAGHVPVDPGRCAQFSDEPQMPPTGDAVRMRMPVQCRAEDGRRLSLWLSPVLLPGRFRAALPATFPPPAGPLGLRARAPKRPSAQAPKRHAELRNFLSTPTKSIILLRLLCVNKYL